MSEPSRRAFRGLIRALCPPPPGPTLPDLEDRIEMHMRRMLQYMVPIVALGFVVALFIVDFSPIWRLRAFSRVQKMDHARAERMLREMGESRSPLIRMLILGVRGLVLSTFYDQDEVHAAMQWKPLPFFDERVALRQRLLRGELSRAEDSLIPEPAVADEPARGAA
jgi:hypothetical protein